MELHCILPITYSDCNHFHSALELAEVRGWSVLDFLEFTLVIVVTSVF